MSSIKKKKNDRYVLKKSDIDFYKMTGVFAIACIFVLLALKMKDSQILKISSGNDLTYNFYMFCKTPLFIAVAAVALVGAVLWFTVCRIKKIDESRRIFTSTNCLSIVLYLAFFTVCFGIQENSTNHIFFIVVTIVAAALYFVSKIYYPDFVMYSAVTAVFAVAINLWALRFEALYVIVKLVVIALVAAACIYFNKKLDNLKVSKKKKAAFLKFPVYIPFVLGAIFLFWAYFQNMAFFRSSETLQTVQKAIYLTRNKMTVILLIQYIAFAIVYTVRRIKD